MTALYTPSLVIFSPISDRIHVPALKFCWQIKGIGLILILTKLVHSLEVFLQLKIRIVLGFCRTTLNK